MSPPLSTLGDSPSFLPGNAGNPQGTTVIPGGTAAALPPAQNLPGTISGPLPQSQNQVVTNVASPQLTGSPSGGGGGGGSGTVTGVTASAPLASSGGAAPNITIAPSALPGNAPWVNCPSGGTVTVLGGAGVVFIAVDGTGAPNTINLPSSAQAVDGQLAVVAISSSAPGPAGQQATSTPNLTINPGAGNQIQDPNNAGAIVSTGLPVVVRTQGSTLQFKYRAATVAPFTAPGWVQVQ